MKRFFCLLMTVFLMSCASTPGEVLQNGDKFTFQATGSSRVVADCLSKNADNLSPNLVSKVQPGNAVGLYEVVVHSTKGDGGTMFVFVVAPLSKGSSIDAYVTKSVFVSSGKGNLVKSIVDTCK